MKKGKLIVIDGTDGSGKATQVARLKDRLREEGQEVESIDFPRYYDNFFGKFIGECLKGDHGDWIGLDPKIASTMYAADRFESSKEIRGWVEQGKTVILDRYVSSNQIHQGGKIDDPEARKEFMQWLDTLEHGVFGIPRPDLIIFLNVPIRVTQSLLKEKSATDRKKYLEGTGDQAEDNPEHLEASKQAGLKLISENNNWVQIDCAPDGDMRSIEDIHEEIYGQLEL